MVVEPEGESRSDCGFVLLGGKASPSVYLHRRNTSHLIQEGDARECLNQEAEVIHHLTRRARESSLDSLELGSEAVLPRGGTSHQRVR